MCPYSDEYKVKTKDSWMGLRSYLRIFLKLTFKSTENYFEALRIGKVYLPDLLFHGTTTIFLNNIVEHGLLKSEAGKCWHDDRPRKVWLTDSLYAAESFAVYSAKKLGENPVVLLIDTNGLEGHSEVSCEGFTPGKSAFSKYLQFSIDRVPQNRIIDYLIVPKDKSISGILTALTDIAPIRDELDKLFIS